MLLLPVAAAAADTGSLLPRGLQGLQGGGGVRDAGAERQRRDPTLSRTHLAALPSPLCMPACPALPLPPVHACLPAPVHALPLCMPWQAGSPGHSAVTPPSAVLPCVCRLTGTQCWGQDPPPAALPAFLTPGAGPCASRGRKSGPWRSCSPARARGCCSSTRAPSWPAPVRAAPRCRLASKRRCGAALGREVEGHPHASPVWRGGSLLCHCMCCSRC